jgi:hypothetical protein
LLGVLFDPEDGNDMLLRNARPSELHSVTTEKTGRKNLKSNISCEIFVGLFPHEDVRLLTQFMVFWAGQTR